MRSSSKSSASSAKRIGEEPVPVQPTRIAVQRQSADYSRFQRVGIFIDVQNLYHSAKHLNHGRGRVNYRELISFLVGERQLVRALAYAVESEAVLAERGDTPVAGKEEAPKKPTRAAAKKIDSEGKEVETTSSEKNFFAALTDAGIELRLKDLQIFADGSKKADWDVGMAVDAIRTANSLDVIIIVSGDGDFTPLVDYLRWGMGKYVEVAAFRPSTSGKMQTIADRFIDLTTAPGVLARAWRR